MLERRLFLALHFALPGIPFTIKVYLYMGTNQYYEHRLFKEHFGNIKQHAKPPIVAHIHLETQRKYAEMPIL